MLKTDDYAYKHMNSTVLWKIQYEYKMLNPKVVSCLDQTEYEMIHSDFVI